MGVELALVPISRVLPHEVPDANRVRRLTERLREDRIQRDPILVAKVPGRDGYILLDGTNRRASLEGLGYQLVVAQLLAYEDRDCLRLGTWSHLVSLPIETLLSRVIAVSDIQLEEVKRVEAEARVDDRAQVAAIHHGSRSWMVFPNRPTANRSGILVELVSTYESLMRREVREIETATDKLAEVHRRVGSDDVALVTFPLLREHDVVNLALHGNPMAAGITRHIVRCGRSLRINVPLAWLSADTAIHEAEEELERLVAGLTPRRYTEPTILFDS
jgi:hypothetical protein